ncbi:hypothetical protein [Capnocytophaga leadbetteri]|uniref:hypothetical protein n=1 Tax=Capnocytophaga leadbetteri TaxID=327575 RepID=UPI0028D8E696|nr:hypothetical protein [Capnocytophaga leadbetteri]
MYPKRCIAFLLKSLFFFVEKIFFYTFADKTIMLDLKALEKELDEVLAQETERSLISWIQNRRKEEIISSKERYSSEYKDITEDSFLLEEEIIHL